MFVAAKGGKEGGEFGVDNTGDLLRETAAAKEAGKVLVASVSTDLVKELKKGCVQFRLSLDRCLSHARTRLIYELSTAPLSRDRCSPISSLLIHLQPPN